MSIDEINLILIEASGTEPMIEPMDDEKCDFWEWAEIVGCVDEFVPVYFEEV